MCTEAEMGKGEHFSKSLYLSEVRARQIELVLVMLFSWKAGGRSSGMQGEEEEINWLGLCNWTLPCFWLNQLLPKASLSFQLQILFKGLGKVGIGVRMLAQVVEKWEETEDKETRDLQVTTLLVLTAGSSGVFSQVSYKCVLMTFLLAQARPCLPHQGVASSRHLAGVLSDSRRITYLVFYTLHPYQKWSSWLEIVAAVSKYVDTCWLKWEVVSGGQAYSLWGKNGFNFHIKLSPPFLCSDKKVLDAWQVASSGFGLCKVMTISPPLLITF